MVFRGKRVESLGARGEVFRDKRVWSRMDGGREEGGAVCMGRGGMGRERVEKRANQKALSYCLEKKFTQPFYE